MAKGEFKLKDVEVLDIISLRCKGRTFAEIAEVYSVSPSSILKKINREKVRPIILARDLLKRYRVIEAPVNVLDIARSEGYCLEGINLPKGITGYFESKTIRFNTDISESEKRYAIAKQMGHDALKHMLYEKKKIITKNTICKIEEISDVESWQEMVANKFAMELLVPEKQLMKTIKKYDYLSFEEVYEIARKFKVSDVIISFKLSSLGYEI
jgi:hypothetical protein